MHAKHANIKLIPTTLLYIVKATILGKHAYGYHVIKTIACTATESFAMHGVQYKQKI